MQYSLFPFSLFFICVICILYQIIRLLLACLILNPFIWFFKIEVKCTSVTLEHMFDVKP